MDAGEQPPLFKLSDFDEKVLPSTYYQENLIYIKEMEINNYFQVDEILKERLSEGGEKEYLCTFVGQSKKLCQWLTKDQFVE